MLSVNTTSKKEVACGIMFYENKVLMGLRSRTGKDPGIWEFPGGKIEKNESAEKAIIREIKEETNLDIKAPTYLGSIKHQYSHFGVNISLFISHPKSIRKLFMNQDFRWIRFDEIDKYALPKANHKMLDIIKKLD